ncbi:hypothetical protein BHM03_00010565, partial [Ensete ventricosum]
WKRLEFFGPIKPLPLLSFEGSSYNEAHTRGLGSVSLEMAEPLPPFTLSTFFFFFFFFFFYFYYDDDDDYYYYYYYHFFFCFHGQWLL